MAEWQRTLTPEDIKKENAYRTAQRRAGKSRRGNIKDPNAPKKPLSAYFMFLQWIRADEERVRKVFGEERETTAQSVLAAETWRNMSDEEKKVSFVALCFLYSSFFPSSFSFFFCLFDSLKFPYFLLGIFTAFLFSTFVSFYLGERTAERAYFSLWYWRSRRRFK